MVLKFLNIYELDCTFNFNHFCVYLCKGQRCDTVFDGCKDKPCKNGGTCAVASNTKHGYICKCPPVSARHLYLTHLPNDIFIYISSESTTVHIISIYTDPHRSSHSQVISPLL